MDEELLDGPGSRFIGESEIEGEELEERVQDEIALDGPVVQMQEALVAEIGEEAGGDAGADHRHALMGKEKTPPMQATRPPPDTEPNTHQDTFRADVIPDEDGELISTLVMLDDQFERLIVCLDGALVDTSTWNHADADALHDRLQRKLLAAASSISALQLALDSPRPFRHRDFMAALSGFQQQAADLLHIYNGIKVGASGPDHDAADVADESEADTCSPQDIE